MKILITGVAGFLGSHLAQNLSESGHKIVGKLYKVLDWFALNIGKAKDK